MAFRSESPQHRWNPGIFLTARNQRIPVRCLKTCLCVLAWKQIRLRCPQNVIEITLFTTKCLEQPKSEPSVLRRSPDPQPTLSCFGVVKEYATATASCKGQNNMPKLIFHLQKWGQAAPEASNFRATGDGRIITWLVNRLFMRAAINRGSVRDGQTGQIRIGMST